MSIEHPVLTMKWENVLFAHWTFAPEVVQELLPEPLNVDTFGGKAYVGIVPFEMNEIHYIRFPKLKLSFPEINLRTYVTVNGRRGVYFFNLDATSRLGVLVARALFGIPYFDAKVTVAKKERKVAFNHRRKGSPVYFDGVYEPVGPIFLSHPDSLEYFLTERYSFFSVHKKWGVIEGRIDHQPWPLQRASLLMNHSSLFEASRFPAPDGHPHLLFCREIEVSAEKIKRIPIEDARKEAL